MDVVGTRALKSNSPRFYNVIASSGHTIVFYAQDNSQ